MLESPSLLSSHHRVRLQLTSSSTILQSVPYFRMTVTPDTVTRLPNPSSLILAKHHRAETTFIIHSIHRWNYSAKSSNLPLNDVLRVLSKVVADLS